MDVKRFALLIDSDNISAAYINNIFDELSQYGIISYKRIYGDWNSNNSSWNNSICFNNSVKSNRINCYSNRNIDCRIC